MQNQGITFLIVLLFSLQTYSQSNSEYSLSWSDEFNNEILDTTVWGFNTGAKGWGNNEWQNYTTTNHMVSDGTLKISAKLEGKGQKVGDYTSSRIVSKESFSYGKFEVSAKVPELKGNGIWPAVWLLGENIKEIGWPECGEIDLMEYVSYAPDTIYFTLHSVANNHSNGEQITSGPVALASVDEEFHTYGLVWSEDYLELYLDDEKNVMLRFDKPENANQDNWPYHTPFFFIFNIAVGGDWGGLHGVNDSIFPQTMEIDYVRYYTKNNN